MKDDPVLDRSPRLRAGATALGLTCLDDEFAGWRVPHRFTCAAGHFRLLAPSDVLNAQSGCRPCRDDAHMAELQDAARRAGTCCLDDIWRGGEALYRFECPVGHRWMRAARLGQQAHRTVRCPTCVRAALPEQRRDPSGLDRLRELARARGGECLSSEYLGNDRRYGFRCAAGHEWETQAVVLFQGSWCARCAHEGRARASRLADGLQRLQSAARKRGGECLDSEYTTVGARYRLRCAHGHEWAARGSTVFEGRWCQRCAVAEVSKTRRKPDGLERLQQAAQAKGGRCLSARYTTSGERYRFECAKGHTWTAIGDAILRGTWCATCAIDAKRLSIDDARAVARERGGECLSDRYATIQTRLTWVCSEGHSWRASLANVKSGGTWCPECAHARRITNAKSMARRRYVASARLRGAP